MREKKREGERRKEREGASERERERGLLVVYTVIVGV